MTEKKTFKDILVTDDINVLIRSHNCSQMLDFMILCLEGSAILEWDDKVLTITGNDLMFSSANKRLSIVQSSPDFRYRIFAANSKMLGEVVFTCLREEKGWISKLRFILEQPIIHLNENQVGIISSYRNLVHYYIVEQGFYKKRIAFLQAQAIIFELLSWVDDAMVRYVPTEEDTDNAKSYDWYWKFLHLLHDNFCKEHTVGWYAEKLQITPAYLHQICKQVCNKPPQQMINEILLKEAKRLLTLSETPVKEIAYSLSFSSESNFCKFFKRMAGSSPAVFRKEKRNH